MSDLTPEIVDTVLAACQAGAEEAAGALSRTLDAELNLEVGEAAKFDPDAAPEGFDGPGMVVLMKFGAVGAAAMLPSASGLLPDWIAAPDATGESKLSTLAQELSMLLVPETLFADDFKAAWVEDLSAAVARGEFAADAPLVPLTLAAGEQTGQLSLIWPTTAPDELFLESAASDDSEASAPAPEAPAAESPPPATQAAGVSAAAIAQSSNPLGLLPTYSRSLLRVEVPVTVRLASKKQSIDEIIDLGPGAIISFEKLCDDPIELTVGDIPVGVGEAVKVGEKFGIRIDEIVLPGEQFKTVTRPAG